MHSHLQHYCVLFTRHIPASTPPTPEETLVEAAKQLGMVVTEVAQKNPLYNSLTNFKGLQQLANICGNKLLRVVDSKKPLGNKTDISAPRVAQQHLS